MDLTTTHPRSMRDTIAGVAGVARLFDKAVAKLRGNLGDYTLDRPMDMAVFDFLGIDLTQFLAAAQAAHDDDAFASYVRTLMADRPAAEIERFNEHFLRRGPEPGSALERSFLELRNEVAPDRIDIKAWADLVDLDEGRKVPLRSHL